MGNEKNTSNQYCADGLEGGLGMDSVGVWYRNLLDLRICLSCTLEDFRSSKKQHSALLCPFPKTARDILEALIM